MGQIRYSPERYIASLGSSADRCNCGNDRAAKAEIFPCGNVHQRMHDPDASGYRMQHRDYQRGTAFQTASACQRGRRIRDVCGQQFRDPCVGYGRFQRVYLTVRGTSGVPGDLWRFYLF